MKRDTILLTPVLAEYFLKAFNKYMSAISKYDKLVKDAREKLKED